MNKLTLSLFDNSQLSSPSVFSKNIFTSLSNLPHLNYQIFFFKLLQFQVRTKDKNGHGLKFKAKDNWEQIDLAIELGWINRVWVKSGLI